VHIIIQNKNYPTPLHLALFYGRLDIAQVLLDHGATVNSQDIFGRTPLHLVALGEPNFEQDRICIAQLLLECGADVNAQDGGDRTPLHWASYNGRVAITRVLLDSGAATNPKDIQGGTPLHSVAEGIYLYSKDDGIRVAQLLLEHGADVNALDENNITPLHSACYFGRVEIARVLLDGGATTNTKYQGRTPMHAAAESGDYNDVLVAQLLLEHGADVDVLDDDNQTPLHLASFFGRVEMVLVLLSAGANASTENTLGLTPLHLVSQGPYHSEGDSVGITQLLLEHGADVNAQDKNHASPLDLALYHGRTEIASVLLHYGDTDNGEIDEHPTPRQLGLQGSQSHEENCPPSTHSLGATVSGAWVRERQPKVTSRDSLMQLQRPDWSTSLDSLSELQNHANWYQLGY
jgi:ankyrin